MAFRDELGTRMKEYYEQIPKTKLMRRTPVIIRIDGKAFHSFTKGFKKPFDDLLIKTMQETTKYLCENIQGCVLGYTQSDEITLVLIDYKTLNSQAWFDYEVQKMCSIAASMATMRFNQRFADNVDKWGIETFGLEWYEGGTNDPEVFNSPEWKMSEIYCKASQNGAMFDARCFNIPKEEVTNCVYWRQLDATRNSIQMVGQANFSHKELQGKSCNQIQDMLHEEKGINWNDFPTYQKRGSCCVKESYYEDGSELGVRTRWIIDKDIPEFKGDGREYIERLINVGE